MQEARKEQNVNDLLKSPTFDRLQQQLIRLYAKTDAALREKTPEEDVKSEAVFRALFAVGAGVNILSLSSVCRPVNEVFLQQAEIRVRKLVTEHLRRFNVGCQSALSAGLWFAPFHLHALCYPLIMRMQSRYHAAAQGLRVHQDTEGKSALYQRMQNNPYFREVIEKNRLRRQSGDRHFHHNEAVEGILAKNLAKKIDEMSKKIVDLKDEQHLQNLQKHSWRNDGPIYAIAQDPDKAVYTPLTARCVREDKLIVGKPDIISKILSESNHLLKLSDSERKAHYEKRFEVRLVTEEDCKNEKCTPMLIGQSGVFAKENISAWDLTGIYSGIYIRDQKDLNFLLEEQGRDTVLSYLYRFVNHQFPKISGFRYGSFITIINSPTAYLGTKQSVARELLTRTNMRTYYLRSGENDDPNVTAHDDAYDIIAVYATRDVKKGEQLFLDYGPEYWRARSSEPIQVPDSKDYFTVQKQHLKKHQSFKSFTRKSVKTRSKK